MPLEIRPLQPAEWPQLRRALAQHSPTWLAPHSWDWRYQHPDGGLKSWIAIDSGVIRAHVGVMRRAGANGRHIGLWRDTFVRNAQRGGLQGRALIHDVCQEVRRAEQAGADLIVQFASSRLAACQQRLALGTATFHSEWLTLDTATMPTANDVLVYQRPHFDASTAALWRSPIRKTAAQLNWRYDARYGQRNLIYVAYTADQAAPIACLVLTKVDPQREMVLEAHLPPDLALARAMLGQIARQRAAAGVRHLTAFVPYTAMPSAWHQLGWPLTRSAGTVCLRYWHPAGIDAHAILAGLSLGDGG